MIIFSSSCLLINIFFVKSWMVEIKSTSQDGIPARHVVKKVTKTCKKGGDMGLDKNNLFENKVFKTKIQVPHLLDTASEETWSDTKQREKIRKVSDGLDEIAAAARKFNKPTSSTPQLKRQTKLASSQLFPFIGNSTVKRIITGVIPSVSAYDPFAVVEDTKIRNLLHFLLDDEYASFSFLLLNNVSLLFVLSYIILF